MALDSFKVEDLITLFSECFLASTNTILVRGESDPLYLPCGHGRRHNEIHFAHGFFASALHEVAHWTIAGSKRRQQIDYGYWYKPDGRNSFEQLEFFRVESKPQAIEWIFADACAFPFHLSLDNLHGDPGDEYQFHLLVSKHKEHYLAGALPPRAQFFRTALSERFGKQTKKL